MAENSELLDHVVAGAIIDFAAFLTTRDTQVRCSAKDDAAPIVEAIREFLTKRGVDQSCEPMVKHWQDRCSKLNRSTLRDSLLALLPGESLRDAAVAVLHGHRNTVFAASRSIGKRRAERVIQELAAKLHGSVDDRFPIETKTQIAIGLLFQHPDFAHIFDEVVEALQQ